MYFSSQQEAQLKEIISGIERRTGVQILAMVVGKSDAYPEAPWKAFALASSISALALTLQAGLDPPWVVPYDAALFTVMVLGIGLLSALLTVILPAFARWFVSPSRREAEVERYARAAFLDREMSQTRNRVGILILVSLFERKVVVLPDSGVADRLKTDALEQVVERMRPHLSKGRRYQVLADGLAELEEAFLAAGFTEAPAAPDEIADELVQERGAEE